MADVPARGDLIPAVFAAALLAVVVSASAEGLTGVRGVSLSVELQHPLDALSVEGLLARLEDGVSRAEPPIRVRDDAPNRLRLVVSIRPVSATVLRGFWLPFSGTYAIGAVALEMERRVTAPGIPHSFPAIVWREERAAAGPWPTVDVEIMRLTDELIAKWLEALRHAP